MGSNNNTIKKSNIITKTVLKKVPLESRGNILIPEFVLDKINYLCKSISDKEWSAVLFYRITGGSLDNIKDLKLELVDLYPQDIGTFATTDFTNDVDLIDIYEENEELEDCRVGSIHSHNTMGAFHSGTDIEDMEDNCQVYNIYLSVVVNNAGDKVAKIAVPMTKTTSGTVTMSYTIKDDDGKIISLNNNERVEDATENVILMVDMDIEEEVTSTNFPTSFIQRVKDLISQASRVVHHVTGFSNINHFESKHPIHGTQMINDINDRNYNTHVPILDKRVVVSFIEHYLTGNGTVSDITGRTNLYGLLYKLSVVKDINAHMDECDTFLMDILESFHEDGYDRAELVEAAIKEVGSYNSYNKEVNVIGESLQDFARTYFIHKEM